jgi:hypothetical protein
MNTIWGLEGNRQEETTKDVEEEEAKWTTRQAIEEKVEVVSISFKKCN